RPADAGAIAFADGSRVVAVDRRPMEFASMLELLRYLTTGADVQKGPAHPIDATTTLFGYVRPAAREMFEVVQTEDAAMSGGGATSITRTRFVEAAGATWELYAQLCNGAPDWCAAALTIYLQTMKEHPPPVPARGAAATGG
ncbi:MAG TPA: hypothetical protein VGC30_01695, partial [Dokdonella sp.]